MEKQYVFFVVVYFIPFGDPKWHRKEHLLGQITGSHISSVVE